MYAIQSFKITNGTFLNDFIWPSFAQFCLHLFTSKVYIHIQDWLMMYIHSLEAKTIFMFASIQWLKLGRDGGV